MDRDQPDSVPQCDVGDERQPRSNRSARWSVTTHVASSLEKVINRHIRRNAHAHANAVSADGSVVVGWGDTPAGSKQAFRWTLGGGMVGLGDLSGGIFLSEATDVSADGAIVVGSSNSVLGTEAFIWDSTNGMQELDQVLVDLGLDLTGWTLEEARAISADGFTVVGYGTNPLGQTEAWIATIPEPSTALLLSLGLVGLSARRRALRA